MWPTPPISYSPTHPSTHTTHAHTAMPEAAVGPIADSSQNLWRSLLQEAAAARPPRLPNGHVVFLGDPAAGKTRLVQRFCSAAAAASTGAYYYPEEEETEAEVDTERESEGLEDGNGSGGVGFLPREVSV
jgi:hypothetical protein